MAELQNRVKAANFGLLQIPVYTGITVAVAYEALPDAPHAHELAAAALFVALFAGPVCVGAQSILLTQAAAFALAEDSVEQLAVRTRRATAASVDFDDLADGVYRTHVATTKLSRLMEPSVLQQALANLLVVGWFVVMSVAPRPAYSDCERPDCDLMNDLWGAGHWYNFFFNPYLLAVLAVVASGLTIYTLFAPARVTSACQRVAEAVNDLRVTAKDGEPAKLATPEQLHRIEGLKRYINELNRDQGLGILFLRKRITYTLVMGMLIQTVSAMVVINTTLMSILHAENDEEAAIALMNRSKAGCP